MGIIRSGVRMSAGELGCTYASLILHDDGQEVTEDKIKALLKAANVETEAYWPGLFCRAFNDFEGGMDKLVTTPALGGGGGGDGPAEKKKSSSEEDDMAAPAASIFGDDGDDY